MLSPAVCFCLLLCCCSTRFSTKMFPNRLYLLSALPQYLKHILRKKSDSTKESVGKLFFQPRVQDLLKRIANAELEKVFSEQKTGQKLKPPEYKFMTDEELDIAFKEADERAKKWQQMPPILDPRGDQVQIISEDVALDGHDEHGAKFVFTDITYGVPEQERLIVVREPDGLLKKADWDQRHRMNEIYSPRPGREYVTPPMFEQEHLENLLDRKEYKFILDRACAQFEPDDPVYIRVTSTTYNRVAKEKAFSSLHATRHFGSLVFYLVFNKQIDLLLLENLQNERLDDAVSLINLYHMIHPNCASVEPSINLEGLELIRTFIEHEASKRSVLELALKAFTEKLADQKMQLDTLEKVHGIKN